MPHVFTSERVRSLLRAKRLAFLGCSNVRAIYKDLVCLYRMNSLIPNDLLKQKMEESCLGDYLVKHGKQYNGRDYLEERIFCNAHTTMFFYFLTKIHSDYVQTVLLCMADIPPDVVIVSSCLWDITRWGPCGVDEYKENLHLFFWGLRCALPQSSVVIWLTAAPLSQSVNGGFLLPQLDFLKYSLRFHVNEANYFCKETAEKFGFDVIDIHYHLRMMLEYRAEDGIHWRPMAVRLCTNLILTHLALSWGKKLPNSDSFLTVREKKCAEENANNVPDEADAVDGYLSDESSQSNIIGGELIPEKHWYNDVFGYEEIALEQETDRGSPKSDLTYSDTSSSDEEDNEGSHRNDLALSDIYDSDEEEEETGVFRDPLGESDAIDINDMIILEEENEADVFHDSSGESDAIDINDIVILEEENETGVFPDPLRESDAIDINDMVILREENETGVFRDPLSSDTIDINDMIILEEINESSPIAEHACSGFYDGYEIGEDESRAPVQPLFDSITFDELLWQEEPTEGVLPAEPSYIGCYDDMVEEEEWNEDALSAEDSGIVCNADTFCREDRNEDDLYAEHSDMLFIADMVETEEPSEGNLLIDCDVIVGNADILETEDERSPPWEQPSFRCSPSAEEPCEGSFPAEHTGIVGNAYVTETEEPCEGTLPVDHIDIMGNTDVVDAQGASENCPPTESKFCGVFGSDEILLEKVVKRRKTKRRNKKRRRRPNSETQGSTSQHGSCQLGQAPEDSHCQPDMKYQSGDFCADVSDPPLPSCGCPGPFNEAVKRRKANRPNKKRRKRPNTETQGSTPQHGSGQLGQATEYSHCQPDLKYQSGDSGADVSGAPLPSTSQNGFHQTCGPASFHFTVFL